MLAHNPIMKVPALKGPASQLRDSCSPLQTWDCLFTTDMLEEIVHHTNKITASYRTTFTQSNFTELRDTSIIELQAFFGLLYFTAIFKSNNESIATLSMKSVYFD